MMALQETWQHLFLKRFSDREDLDERTAMERFWRDLPQAEVESFFCFVRAEYRLSPGLLRPSDEAALLSDPIRACRPVAWLIAETRLEDASSELNYELGKRLDRYNTRDRWHSFTTVDDIVRAWCGQGPRAAGD